MKLDSVFDMDDEVQFLYKWFFKRDKTRIDNIVFYMHYHATTVFFFLGCLLITIGMYIMDPIDCIADSAVNDVIDNFCLYHSTYTISGGTINNHSVHPGVPIVRPALASETKFHNYYLWVALVLAIQTSFFYIPRGIWKGWEGSRVQTILNIKSEIAFGEEDEKEEAEERLKDEKLRRLSSYIASKTHRSYYGKLLFCELLNLINAIVQLLLTDLFLGFGLTQLNSSFFQLISDGRPFERNSAVEQMFPKVTACTFHIYGPTGNVVNYEALCVLPINAINEKLFCLIYIWLIMLIIISLLAVLYRLLFLFTGIRKLLLKPHLNNEVIHSGELRLNDLKSKVMGVGNWQLLHQLVGNDNIDSWEFTNIVMHICDHVKRKNWVYYAKYNTDGVPNTN